MCNPLSADRQRSRVRPVQVGPPAAHLVWTCVGGRCGEATHPQPQDWGSAESPPCACWELESHPQEHASLPCTPEIWGVKAQAPGPNSEQLGGHPRSTAPGRVAEALTVTVSQPAPPLCPALLPLDPQSCWSTCQWDTFYESLSPSLLPGTRLNESLTWVVWFHTESNLIGMFVSWEFKTGNKAGNKECVMDQRVYEYIERHGDSCIEPRFRKISWRSHLRKKKKDELDPPRETVTGEVTCPRDIESIFPFTSLGFQDNITYFFNKYLWDPITT